MDKQDRLSLFGYMKRQLMSELSNKSMDDMEIVNDLIIQIDKNKKLKAQLSIAKKKEQKYDDFLTNSRDTDLYSQHFEYIFPILLKRRAELKRTKESHVNKISKIDIDFSTLSKKIKEESDKLKELKSQKENLTKKNASFREGINSLNIDKLVIKQNVLKNEILVKKMELVNMKAFGKKCEKITIPELQRSTNQVNDVIVRYMEELSKVMNKISEIEDECN